MSDPLLEPGIWDTASSADVPELHQNGRNPYCEGTWNCPRLTYAGPLRRVYPSHSGIYAPLQGSPLDHDARCTGDCYHCGGLGGVDIGVGFQTCMYCHNQGCGGCSEEYQRRLRALTGESTPEERRAAYIQRVRAANA